MKELSCPQQASNVTCGPMKDLFVISVGYHLVGVVMNIMMIVGIVWAQKLFCIPWLGYQATMSFILILGPFLLLYYNVPNMNRYEIRNGVVDDYPERWQTVTMIVPNLLGILCLYIFCHGALVVGELGAKTVKPKAKTSDVSNARNVFVINTGQPSEPPGTPKKASVVTMPEVHLVPSSSKTTAIKAK